MSLPLSTDQLALILVFIAVLLSVNGIGLALASYRTHRRGLQRRLNPLESQTPSRTELSNIRRERSLTPDGDYAMRSIPLNKLILQSGVTVGPFRVMASMVCVFAASYLLVFALQKDHLIAVVAASAIGMGAPILVLMTLRDRRRRRFEEQLPDAVDVLVRSLRAGHSIPVAINTVARQMPDPIGGEFAIAAGELTYGLDLETALVNLRIRVGQADLGLVVLAVSMQSKMGGNLAEILSNPSHVIRARFRLRRKARALSAEGRFSALALTVLPPALFAVLWVIAPTYYGQVWGQPVVNHALLGCVVWLTIGNIVMHRMVRFAI
jgi:tight adherence protein B